MYKYIKIILFACFAAVVCPAMAQGEEFDPRLIEYKGMDDLVEMQSNNPDKLAQLEFMLENIFLIQDLGYKGGTGFPDVSTIIKLSPDAPDITNGMLAADINPFYYDFNNQNKQKIYSLGGGKVLIVRSAKGILEHFEHGKVYIAP